MPAAASPRPAALPAAPSARLSVNNWRTIRHRVAPCATRMATSRARCAERAISRLATLAQAMSRTNATAPINVEMISLTSAGFAQSLNVRTTASVCSFVSGYCWRSRPASARTSASAASRPTPGASRPTVDSIRLSRRSRAPVGCKGRQVSEFSGKRIPSGMTPTIVDGSSLTRTTRPSTAGSPA